MRALALLLITACGRDHFDPAHNIAFVTSTVHDPLTFGTDGSGADAICAQTASNAGLGGEYRALVATSSVPSFDHLGNARGWIRTDGTPLVDLVTDLQTGHLLHPLRIDENGEDLGTGAVTVATGSSLSGHVPNPGNCNDWSNPASTFGSGLARATGNDFIQDSTSQCTSTAHLYCFGVGFDAPLEVTPADGRLAFVTVEAYVPTGGLVGADALCASEASAAHLPGTFRALLGTQAASAASRFDLSGPTWVRTDGIALADSPLAFVNGDLATAPSVTAIGTEAIMTNVMTGGPVGVASPMSCGDWTGTGLTNSGNAEHASSNAFMVTTASCVGLPIYCLAE